MGEFRRLTVELDDRTIEMMDGVVGEARFADTSEVVRYALSLFDKEERGSEQAYQDLVELIGIERLREMIEEGFASGDPVEATPEFYEDVKRRGRERLAQARAAE